MSFRPNAFALAATLVLTAALATGAIAQPKVKSTKCPVFPADNPWNQRVDQLPVADDSTTLVRSIGPGSNAHADFGSGKWDGGPIGIPYVVVGGKQKKVRVSFEYADESDRVRYPVPKNAPIEGGRNADGDRHVIVIDKTKCKLYELYAAYPRNGGKNWTAGSGAIWSLKSNKLRPSGWTSADAAGLPIYPGLARYEEVAKGEIAHALRFTAPRTRKEFVYPARHQAGSSNDSGLPPMGARLRLKSSVNIASFPRQSRVVLTALRRYGMILADNGSPWYVSGAPDSRWDNDDLRSIGDLSGSDFEVVDTSSLPRPGA
ncbi:MAG: hypothetical protein HYX29_01070 [Solirubrobacterales bacterium]|nr:hypothetical protein [Solirubrobacterales bacterium]